MAHPIPATSVAEGAQAVTACPFCGCETEAVTMLAESQDDHLLHVRCGRCNVALIGRVLVTSCGVSSVGLVTDLAAGEVRPARERGPVEIDDVIELHRLLHGPEAQRIFGA